MTDVFALGPPPQTGGLRPLAPDFNPADLGGTFSGLGDELVSAPYRVALGAAATLNLAAAPLVGALGREAEDSWFANMVDPPLRSLAELDERSMIHGTAARVIGSLLPIVAEAPLGPAGVGVLEGVKRAGLEARAGSDIPLELGLTTGVTLAAGFALPMALPVMPGWGPALLQRLGYGVGSNVALGVAQRATEAGLGEDVRVMDGLALTVDAALGAFFGAAGHAYLRLRGEKSPAGPVPEQVQANADAAMVMLEQASAQRAVPPGADPQAALDHLAARQAGKDVPDPDVPPEVAKIVDDDAADAEATLRAADPALARMDEPGAGKPEAMPVVEPPAGKETGQNVRPAGEDAPAESWAPLSEDGEAVDFDLAALQQTAAQMDALGLKADDGRTYSQVLDEAAASPEDAASLLDDVSRCVLNYGQ